MSVSRFAYGIFRITITPESIGAGYPFQPAIITSTTDYGRITAYRETDNTIVVDTWQAISGNLLELNFNFIVYNR